MLLRLLFLQCTVLVSAYATVGAGNEAGDMVDGGVGFDPLPSEIFFPHPNGETWDEEISNLTIRGPLNIPELVARNPSLAGINIQSHELEYGATYDHEDVPLVAGGVYEYEFIVTGRGYGGEEFGFIGLKDGTALFNSPIIAEYLEREYLDGPGPNETRTRRKVELLKVDLTSDKAVNSPRTFYSDASGLVTPPSPGSLAAGDVNDLLNEILVIDYDQVLNVEGEVEDFYVEVSVPSNLGSSASWTLTETPGGSAQLTNTSSATARLEFDSDSLGGLYKIDLTIGGTITLEGRVWLPVAGPTINSAFTNEMNFWNGWSTTYGTSVLSRYEAARENLIDEYDVPEIIANLSLVKSRWARNLDMLYLGGSLDWYGDPSGPKTPSGYPKQGTAGTGTPNAHRYTLGGHVIDWPTRNNILYAYIGKKMGILELTLLVGPNIHPNVAGVLNTPDTDVQLNAYYAGFALTSGSIDSVMDQYGRLMIPPDGWAYREWPSYEVTSDGFDLTQEGQDRRQDLLTIGSY